VAAYLQGSPIRRGRLGLLPSAFNPPTIAHQGIVDAAQRQYQLDQVAFVLPEALPHKELEGATFVQRVALLHAAVRERPGWSMGTASGGLFIDIAREFHALCGPDVEVSLLCGRDAAVRIVGWDYGDGPSIAEQLREFQMIVAARRGDYEPPLDLAARIRPLELEENLQRVSSSQVREAITSGGVWKPMVAPGVARIIETQRLYR
jgi:nicotinic acid mononucleotide adenylyltransferase